MNRQIIKTNKAEDQFSEFTQNLANKPYVTTSNNIQITVWPEFIDSKSSIIGDLFIWAYHVRIENKGLEPVKLLNRYWRIIDEKGIIQEVTGEGVVGEQPTIAPNGAYQYSSGVHLRYPSGIMTGYYQMRRLDPASDGAIFDAKIPTFSLDVPSVKGVIN